MSNQPYPICQHCGHRYDHHRHHKGERCYDCANCSGYQPATSPAACEASGGLPPLLRLLASLNIEPEWCNLALHGGIDTAPKEGPAYRKLLALEEELAAGLQRLGWAPPGGAEHSDATGAHVSGEAPEPEVVTNLVRAVAAAFPTFGGGNSNKFNPVSMAFKDSPSAFAAMVPVEAVVRFVLARAGNRSVTANRDAETIAALKAEVRRWTEDIAQSLLSGYHLNAPERAEGKIHIEASRKFLARLESEARP